jgi:hypothetical protein
MKPGDRQQFVIQIPRTIKYKEGSKTKKIKAGRYNSKVVPEWKN